MLHDRQELHVTAPHRIAEKSIDLGAVPFAQTVHHAQRIELHAAGAEQLHCAHHAPERRRSAPVATKGIVDLLGTVERHADQKFMRREEFAPRLVDQHAIGLERIDDPLSTSILPLQLHGTTVEIDPRQQRFAAMPAKRHRIDLVRLDVLPDIELQQLLAHHGLPTAVLQRLIEVVAVTAIEVASRSRSLEHRRKSDRPCLALRIAVGEYSSVFVVIISVLTCRGAIQGN